MANGDITKTTEYDKIEVVDTWAIQVRQATILWEEQADSSKKELTRTFHRHALTPFNSAKDNDNKWTHTATDISGEDASVQAICNAALTDSVKTAYKAEREASS